MSEFVTIIGMIGAWSQETERFPLDRIISSEFDTITLSKQEAANMIEALNRIQEGLVLVLNETA